MAHAIAGFDYVLQMPVERSRAEWRAFLAAALADGGKRRVADGETFIHGPDARIRAEVYANLPAPTTAGDWLDE